MFSSKTSATQCAKLFTGHRVMVYGITAHLLDESGLEFGSTFLSATCSFIQMKFLTTMTHHQQKNVQAKRYIRTLVPDIKHAVSEIQGNNDMVLQQLASVYNRPAHRLDGGDLCTLTL